MNEDPRHGRIAPPLDYPPLKHARDFSRRCKTFARQRGAEAVSPQHQVRPGRITEFTDEATVVSRGVGVGRTSAECRYTGTFLSHLLQRASIISDHKYTKKSNRSGFHSLTISEFTHKGRARLFETRNQCRSSSCRAHLCPPKLCQRFYHGAASDCDEARCLRDADCRSSLPLVVELLNTP